MQCMHIYVDIYACVYVCMWMDIDVCDGLVKTLSSVGVDVLLILGLCA